jgi:hypothetical protein
MIPGGRSLVGSDFSEEIETRGFALSEDRKPNVQAE